MTINLHMTTCTAQRALTVAISIAAVVTNAVPTGAQSILRIMPPTVNMSDLSDRGEIVEAERIPVGTPVQTGASGTELRIVNLPGTQSRATNKTNSHPSAAVNSRDSILPIPAQGGAESTAAPREGQDLFGHLFVAALSDRQKPADNRLQLVAPDSSAPIAFGRVQPTEIGGSRSTAAPVPDLLGGLSSMAANAAPPVIAPPSVVQHPAAQHRVSPPAESFMVAAPNAAQNAFVRGQHGGQAAIAAPPVSFSPVGPAVDPWSAAGAMQSTGQPADLFTQLAPQMRPSANAVAESGRETSRTIEPATTPAPPIANAAPAVAAKPPVAVTPAPVFDPAPAVTAPRVVVPDFTVAPNRPLAVDARERVANSAPSALPVAQRPAVSATSPTVQGEAVGSPFRTVLVSPPATVPAPINAVAAAPTINDFANQMAEVQRPVAATPIANKPAVAADVASAVPSPRVAVVTPTPAIEHVARANPERYPSPAKVLEPSITPLPAPVAVATPSPASTASVLRPVIAPPSLPTAVAVPTVTPGISSTTPGISSSVAVAQPTSPAGSDYRSVVVADDTYPRTPGIPALPTSQPVADPYWLAMSPDSRTFSVMQPPQADVFSYAVDSTTPPGETMAMPEAGGSPPSTVVEPIPLADQNAVPGPLRHFGGAPGFVPYGCPYLPGQSGAPAVCGVDCGQYGAPCCSGWNDARRIPWSLFGPGEYVGPARTEHVSTYYVRVNDIITLTFITSRKKEAERYRIGVGDRLRLDWLRSPNETTETALDREVLVQPDGTIALPLVGEITVAGKTVNDVREELIKEYGEFQRDPQITVTPLVVNTAVQDIINAVTAVSGSNGQAQALRVTPEGTIQAPGLGSVYVQGLTLDELRSELEARYSTTFGPGLLVQPSLTERAPTFVFVGGEVRAPSRYALDGPTTVMQAITMAGGWNVGGNLHQVVIFRRDENWCLKATKIDIRAPLYGNDPCPANDVWLRDNDLVIVPKSKILCATDVIQLYFTRGIYAVVPINYVYDFSASSGITPVP